MYMLTSGPDNIDYDDVKHLIKEHTTPGKGKSISVPGQRDEKLHDFENTLFAILEDQHHRIDLFVRSKSGEIRRRLDHAKKQLNQLSARSVPSADQRIPISRLERYGKLENDVLKAGEEIRSLARFTGAQRTAFRKLLKKHKKWTGSTNLEDRFRDEVLDDPKSFTKLDLGPLLDEYSETLQNIRTLYETRFQQAGSQRPASNAKAAPAASIVDQLRAATATRCRVEFDTAIATIPLGDSGEVANYFVHPENVVELQVFLLQYMQYYTARSRSNSAATPVSPGTPSAFGIRSNQGADYFMLVADNCERFAQQQSTITVNQREHAPGIPTQMAKAFVRWNDVEDAMLSARTENAKIKSLPLKRKHVDTFFDRNTPPPKKNEMAEGEKLVSLRNDILKDRAVKPLYKISSCRCRFNGLDDGPQSITMATLDSAISMQNATADAESSTFPFAVLQVRKEGQSTGDLLSILNASHLVERVRGFSLQYHALWQIHKPGNLSQPFWIPMLSQDIRKLPPPAIKRNGRKVDGAPGSGSNGTASTNSVRGITDSTTAVETSRPSSSLFPEQLEAPPLRSFRKKRRRAYARQQEEPQPRYWSEYDHPEDDDEEGDAYVLYIDPNEKSSFDRLFDKVGTWFARSREPEEDALLQSSPTLDDDDTSDEEDGPRAAPKTYGTLSQSHPSHGWRTHHPQEAPFLPQITTICFAASAVILVVAYILAQTSKHKYAAEADVGIIFAIASSLAFAVLGFIPLMRRTDGTWVSFGVAIGVLIVDAICSGFLLAWILGRGLVTSGD
jgi:SPX domain protein involved in polyphosphate accumulation